MEIELPLYFSVDCIPYRHRNRSRVFLMQSVTLPVAEIADEDAPFAARIAFEDEEVLLRWYDGRYWMEDRPDGNRAAKLRCQLTKGFRKEGFYTVSKNGVPQDESLFMFTHFDSWTMDEFRKGRRDSIEDKRVRDIRGDTREEELARVLKAVEGFVFIGGTAWTAVPEPFLIFEVKDGRKAEVSVRLGLPAYDEQEKRFVLSVCQGEEIRELSAMAEEEGLPVSVLMSFEWLGGEAKPVDRRMVDVVNAASACMRRDTYKLSEMSRGQAMAWFDLRDSLKADLQGEAKADVVSESLAAYSEHRDIGTFARMALERWRMRPLDLGAVPLP